MEKTFDYDPLNDSLFISCKKKNQQTFGSIEIDSIVIDFTRDMKVTGLEIIGISKMLENLKIPAEILNNIKNVELNISYKKDALTMFFTIESKILSKPAIIPLGPIPIRQQIFA